MVSFHATVANYEYLVYWRFYQDGNIECEVRATGIMVTSSFPEGEQPPYGTLVDERTYAPFHQHFIVARLDLDIDGERQHGPHDRVRGAADRARTTRTASRCVQRSVPLRTEQEGKQDYDWQTQRAWKVVNETADQRARHAGRLQARARRVLPGHDGPGLTRVPARPGDRPHALGHPLRPGRALAVRRVRRPERARTRGCRCGPRENRSIDNTDVVLWYVFGIHHITRPEDWPVMPVDTVSFWLKPFGFFDRNPALDVPPTERRLPRTTKR